jgi:hypothetical protein
MIARHVTRRISAPQRPRIRTAAAVAGVSVLIGACSRDATTRFVPDAYHLRSAPAADDTAAAPDQVRRELRESVAHQYGSQSAVPPRDQAIRDYRSTVIKLYGPQPPGSNTGE